MKRSKESHELPQGLTPRPYQPGSSTVLFIALNRAPTIRGRAIVPPRTPLSPYLSLAPRLSIATPCRYRAVIYGDIKSGPNYCRVIAQFGADAASIRRQHLRTEIRRIVKGERRRESTRGAHAMESRGGCRQKSTTPVHRFRVRFQISRKRRE